MKYYSFLLLLFCISNSFAQNQIKVDSLQRVLQTGISDRQKVDTYVNLAQKYRFKDSLKIYQYANQAIQLATKSTTLKEK